MTKRKDKQKRPEQKEKEESEKESEEESGLKDAKKDYEIEDKSVEVKQLENKEGGKELEFFSKEELGEKIDKLEQAIEVLEKDLESKETQLKESIEQQDKLKNRLIHLQAEFENSQKRWVRQRQDLRHQHSADVLKSFLPFYDSFSKALDEKSGIKEAIEPFYNQFINIMRSLGATPIKVEEGEDYDYTVHEALTSIEKEDMEENKIIDVIQEGWKLQKDVLRYAKVVISRKPKPPEPKEEEKDEGEEEKIEEEKEGEGEKGGEEKKHEEEETSQKEKEDVSGYEEGKNIEEQPETNQ